MSLWDVVSELTCLLGVLTLPTATYNAGPEPQAPFLIPLIT